MIIEFSQFGGISPRYSDRKLPLPFAVIANNCKMDRGQLRGFGGNEQVFAGTSLILSPKTFHVYKPEGVEYLLQWDVIAEVVDDANTQDSFHRVYWTSEGNVPKMGAKDDIIFGAGSYPYQSYDLGIPSPLGVLLPTRNVTGDSPSQSEIDGGGAQPYFRAYTYTYVSSYGEESPPYLPSDGSDLPVITLYEGDTVTLTGMATAPAGNHPMNPAAGAKKRIYQTDINGVFRLVAEVPLASTSYTLNHMDFDAAPAINNDILLGSNPPADLRGLVLSPYGYMLGFVGNTLYASSRYLFHNWPLENLESATSKIMGLVSVKQGVLVITDTGVYIATGKDPSNISIVKIDDTLGCVSSESIVDMGEYALFASSNGVVFASVTEASIVTSDLILENDWYKYSPETMVGRRHLHRYILQNDTFSFMMNPKGEYDRIVNFDTVIEAGFTSKKDGHLYYCNTAIDGNIYRFDSDKDSPLSYAWKSSTFISKTPTVVSCFKIDAEDFNDITLQVYINEMPLFSGDGLLLDASGIDNRNSNLLYGRLPSFPSGLDVVLELKGSSPINSVYLADSFGELKL